MHEIKHIHFVGIKGVGMAPLALIAKQAGFVVSGSDIAQAFITDHELLKQGIVPLVGFDQSHVRDADLVIATGAHRGFDNVEVQAAKQKNIPVWTQGQAVGEFMQGEVFGRLLTGISVTGCHGKTTTTAMIATLLAACGKDPSYVIGTGDIPSLSGSGHYGQGKYFVAEADEYATEPHYDHTPKFLWQHPQMLVITNIEFDHPDLYSTMEDVQNAYSKLTKNIEKKGVLIANGDDKYSKKIIEEFIGKKIIFGENSSNDFVLQNVFIKNGQTNFSVIHQGKMLGDFSLQVIGRHNAKNALIGLIIGQELGLSLGEIKKGLYAFKGTKRRLEYIGQTSSGMILFDDYAHHPTEIHASLMALREAYPSKKIICIFQPHTYSRTKKLFNEFSEAFSQADEVVLSNIFASARETKDESISSEKLVFQIQKHQQATYIPSISGVVKYIQSKKLDSNYVVVTMGAGDVYTIDKELVNS